MIVSSPIPLICTANNCYRSFKNWNTFRKHLLTCESLIRFQNQIAFVNDSYIGNVILSSLDDTAVTQELENSFDKEEDGNSIIAKKTAKLILNLQGRFYLSHRPLNYFTKEMQSI